MPRAGGGVKIKKGASDRPIHYGQDRHLRKVTLITCNENTIDGKHNCSDA